MLRLDQPPLPRPAPPNQSTPVPSCLGESRQLGFTAESCSSCLLRRLEEEPGIKKRCRDAREIGVKTEG